MNTIIRTIAATATPGWHNHHGITHIAHLNGK